MKGLKCPNCGKRGGVICRVDAYAIFKLGENNEMKMIDTVTFDDVDGYHCTKCDSELNKNDLD